MLRISRSLLQGRASKDKSEQRFHIRQEHECEPVDQPLPIQRQRREGHEANIRDRENKQPFCARPA